MSRRLRLVIILVPVAMVLAVATALAFAEVPQFVYRGCINPDQVVVESLEFNRYVVRLRGATSSSALNYQGFVHRIDGDVLDIGLRYSLAESPSGGGFSVELLLADQELSAIYLTDGKTRKRID